MCRAPASLPAKIGLTLEDDAALLHLIDRKTRLVEGERDIDGAA